MNRNTLLLLATAPILLSVTLLSGSRTYADSTVTHNGAVLSHSVHMVNGRPYVPLDDVARAMGGGLVKTATGYSIVGKGQATAGGANQVEGMNGKVGDVLFDGRWRFQVVSFAQVDTYTETVISSLNYPSAARPVSTFDDPTYTFTPKSGFTFIAVKCHVRNGSKITDDLDCAPGNPHTAITDNQGNSFPPFAYDMYMSNAWITKDLLPGSGEDLTVLFAVPPTFKPADMVFTLSGWNDTHNKDLRIALAP